AREPTVVRVPTRYSGRGAQVSPGRHCRGAATRDGLLSRVCGRRALRRRVGSGDGADLETATGDPDVVARLRGAGRTAPDATVGESEGAAVPGAGDAAVADGALVQGTAHVAARVGQGVHSPRAPVQQDRHPAHLHRAALAVRERSLLDHRRPPLRTVLMSGAV